MYVTVTELKDDLYNTDMHKYLIKNFDSKTLSADTKIYFLDLYEKLGLYRTLQFLHRCRLHKNKVKLLECAYVQQALPLLKQTEHEETIKQIWELIVKKWQNNLDYNPDFYALIYKAGLQNRSNLYVLPKYIRLVVSSVLNIYEHSLYIYQTYKDLMTSCDIIQRIDDITPPFSVDELQIKFEEQFIIFCKKGQFYKLKF